VTEVLNQCPPVGPAPSHGPGDTANVRPGEGPPANPCDRSAYAGSGRRLVEGAVAFDYNKYVTDVMGEVVD
jgi:hypothetical protein